MSKKVDIEYADRFKETMEAMDGDGVLLVSLDANGRPNGLTIGWGTIGTIWGKPIFVALVRPSRNTYGLVERTGDFTVNVMPKDMAEVLSFWGTVSGRDHDKFGEQGLQAIPSRVVKSPIVGQGTIHYECRVVYKNDLDISTLEADILRSAYPRGDYHRLYFGEIVACYADQ